MDRIQIVSIVVTAGLLVAVLELVRRRRLLERYALLWLFSALVLLGLGVWRGLLETVSSIVGVAYPPSALFLVAIGFVLVLLLHFSLAVSRLTDQAKVLAQRVALLDERLRRVENESPSLSEHVAPPSAAPDHSSAEPVLQPTAEE